jgi:predicted kinase
LNEIVIPRNTLILLCGPAGSGKSTWAARHFSPTQIVSSDECRALVSDDPANQRATAEAFHLMNFIIQKRLELRRLTVADATSLKREDRKQLLRIARRLTFHATLVVFDIPIEVCLARNSKRDRMVPKQAITLQYALLQTTLRTVDSEGFDFTYVLDEEAQSAASVTIGGAVSRRSRRPSQKA